MLISALYPSQRRTLTVRTSRKHALLRCTLAALAISSVSGPRAYAQNAAKPGKPNKSATAANAGKSAAGKATSAPTPAQLAYQFTPGTSTRYKLSALFDGHIPPFAQPDSPPIHIKVDLIYIATVKKADKNGATVDFNVDSAELSLFDHELKDGEKVDPDKAATFPIALEDVQKALNASVVLRPDGSIANILSNSSVKVQIDVGFDLRKLFLLTMPVTLSGQPVKVGDVWAGTDGVLGSKAGRITYSNKLSGVQRKGKDAEYLLNQTGASVVEDKLNKEGNTTAKEADVYRTLSGKLDLSGEMTLAVPLGAGIAGGAVLPGQVKSAHIVMNANLVRKRVKVDPDHPEIPENDPLDVKARMTITREATPAKSKPTDKTATNGDKLVPGTNKADKPKLNGDKTASGAK